MTLSLHLQYLFWQLTSCCANLQVTLLKYLQCPKRISRRRLSNILSSLKIPHIDYRVISEQVKNSTLNSGRLEISGDMTSLANMYLKRIFQFSLERILFRLFIFDDWNNDVSIPASVHWLCFFGCT